MLSSDVSHLQWNLSIEDTLGTQLALLYTVEPLYRGHPWDPAGCPVYSGSVPNSNVDLYTGLLYVVGTANSVLSREVSQWCPL